MQAVEIIKSLNESQDDKEERSLAVGLYLSLVAFAVQELENYDRSIAFQVFQVPEDALYSIAIFPREISNLHKTSEKTQWTIQFDIATALEKSHEAIVANLRICEILLAMMVRFAKKYSLSYNTDLEVESFHNLQLVFQFERILSTNE